MLRSFLLAPCMLISLACATAFPVENLEMGMTAEEVRESVGEPEFIHRDQTWIYTHEEWRSWLFVPPSPVFFAGLFSIPIFAVTPDESWDEFYVVKKKAFLHFDSGSLAGWQVDGLGPEGIEKSIVAIKIRGLGGWLSRLQEPPVIYFTRLGADGKHHQGRLLKSDHWSKGYAYLTNAIPGRYAAIGARQDHDYKDHDYSSPDAHLSPPSAAETKVTAPNSTYWFFPGSMIDHTIVTVEPSGVAFMGEFKISGNLEFDDSDEIQQGYSNMLSVTESARVNLMARAFIPPVPWVRFPAEYWKDQSEMATQRFLQSSQSLAEAGWRAWIERASAEDGDNKRVSERPDQRNGNE